MIKSYECIFDEYYEELVLGMGVVLPWWEAMEKTMAAAADEQALLRFHMCWPAGPAAHPRIIAVYRRYYLKIWEINERTNADRERAHDRAPEPEFMWGNQLIEDVDSRFSPDQILIDWLEDRDANLHAIMKKLVFIPVGMEMEPS